MRFFSFLPLILAVPATVSACEGDCIVGITNVFLSNYTRPVHSVMDSLAKQISDIIPSHPGPQVALNYLQPILSAYQKQAYQGMEKAIFPSFFHGKCLNSQGVEPDGCPNPDCPIVCGTPGSLVHFFSQLRYIAFNQTYHTLQALATPGTETYKQVESAVLDAAASSIPGERRSYSPIYSRALTNAVHAAHGNKDSRSGSGSGSGSDSRSSSGLGSGSGSGSGSRLDSIPSNRPQDASREPPSKMLVPVPMVIKRAQNVKAQLRSILAEIRSLMEQACGGSGAEETNGLPGCSWEAPMKEYILTFP